MIYTICYQEKIPRCQTLEANDEHEAIRKLWKMVEDGTTTEKLTGLGHNHEVTNIRAENGDEFAMFDFRLMQYRWQGHDIDETKRLGLY